MSPDQCDACFVACYEISHLVCGFIDKSGERNPSASIFAVIILPVTFPTYPHHPPDRIWWRLPQRLQIIPTYPIMFWIAIIWESKRLSRTTWVKRPKMGIALLKGMLQETFEQGNLHLVHRKAIFHAQPPTIISVKILDFSVMIRMDFRVSMSDC